MISVSSSMLLFLPSIAPVAMFLTYLVVVLICCWSTIFIKQVRNHKKNQFDEIISKVF